MDPQIGVLLLGLVQDQRHRVVTGIHDPHPQARPFHRGPFDVRQDLPGVDQESSAGRGQPHLVGRALHQGHTELPLQTLQPLAQRGLHDVLAGGGPTEMQLLGKSDEIVQPPKLHARQPLIQCCCGGAPPPLVGRVVHDVLEVAPSTAMVSLINSDDDQCACWPFREMVGREFPGRDNVDTDPAGGAPGC
jgi:hypothetical protein